jgi:hypothetical protein
MSLFKETTMRRYSTILIALGMMVSACGGVEPPPAIGTGAPLQLASERMLEADLPGCEAVHLGPAELSALDLLGHPHDQMLLVLVVGRQPVCIDTREGILRQLGTGGAGLQGARLKMLMSNGPDGDGDSDQEQKNKGGGSDPADVEKIASSGEVKVADDPIPVFRKPDALALVSSSK